MTGPAIVVLGPGGLGIARRLCAVLDGATVHGLARRVDGADIAFDDAGDHLRALFAAGTPIVLVHGIFDNRSIFTLLRRGLHRRGFGSTYALNYSPWTDDIRSMAARLGDLVAQVCDETGHEQVHVIGHSMGGLIGRYLVQRMGGDDLVHTLVTLGTPHSGTLPAHVVPLELARQMRIGGALINELAEPAPGCRTRMLVIWSDIDQLVIPQAHGRLDHPDLKARNVLIRGVGHLSLPVDGRVIREIGTTLALLDDADPSPHTSNTM